MDIGQTETEETGRTKHEMQFSYSLANCNSRMAKKLKSSQTLSTFRLAALEKIRISARRLAESLCCRLFYKSLAADVDSFQASEPDVSGGLRVRNAEFFGSFGNCQITGDTCRADHAPIIARRMAICKRLDDSPIGPPPLPYPPHLWNFSRNLVVYLLRSRYRFVK